MSPEGLDLAFRKFKKAFIEAALGAEMGVHLGTDEGATRPGGTSNHSNGTSGKTLLTDDGQVRIDVPRDRAGSFQPQLGPKHARRLEGFDDRIISKYARGMTVRESQGHLSQMYALEVSPECISKVTDAVMSEVVAWQTRSLEPMYPLVFVDALRVKVRARAPARAASARIPTLCSRAFCGYPNGPIGT